MAGASIRLSPATVCRSRFDRSTRTGRHRLSDCAQITGNSGSNPVVPEMSAFDQVRVGASLGRVELGETPFYGMSGFLTISRLFVIHLNALDECICELALI